MHGFSFIVVGGRSTVAEVLLRDECRSQQTATSPSGEGEGVAAGGDGEEDEASRGVIGERYRRRRIRGGGERRRAGSKPDE